MTGQAYQMKVVKGASVSPQPDLQSKLSKQLPARPQSEAAITVVGQNPQRRFSRSTRQSNPPLAVRTLLTSPVE